MLSNLTSDDLVDLGRWHAIQFFDHATAEQAVDRYDRYLARVARNTVARPIDESVSDRAA